MPTFSNSQTLDDHQVGHFGYTAAKIDELEAAQFTLATIVADRSGSTTGFQGDMEAALKSSVQALKKHANSDQILLRVVTFENSSEEFHGFVPVNNIEESQYDGCLQPGGTTALSDSIVDAAQATEDYSGQLASKKFLNNGILIVITDGCDNASSRSLSDVVNSLTSAQQKETLESFSSILIAVNWAGYKDVIENYHRDAGFTQPIIGIETASPESIARVGQFIATSVSSTSMSLGTGSASNTIQF